MPTDSRPFVVLAGPIHADAQALLEKEARVVVCNETEEAVFLKVAADAHGILFRVRPRVTESLMTACKNLKVVGRHGVGLDTVDLPAATRLGIAVVHAPGINRYAVAEHAILLILSSLKKLRQIDKLTRGGGWRDSGLASGLREFRGKTLGIVGVGNIGTEVAKRAAAFGAVVIGFDPYVAEDELRRRGVEPTASLDDLCRRADIITCHTPLTDETRHMIDERRIGLMKQGVIFINTSRGPIQQEAALFEALTRGKIAAAGLDVWEEEPVRADNPLLNLENVTCTAHVAGATQEAHRASGIHVAEEMLRVIRGERPQHIANADLWPRLAHLRPTTD
ncbi:MAG: hydroxyacid dehydrogenase [Candidatus Rokubacteria bacterium]|nr:hydroxyacid dehydrogenase [Candidatus Rokubacteria bacterium]